MFGQRGEIVAEPSLGRCNRASFADDLDAGTNPESIRAKHRCSFDGVAPSWVYAVRVAGCSKPLRAMPARDAYFITVACLYNRCRY